MFVLPPPPRYPAQMMYGGMYPGGQIVPMIETNNILSHPAGPDCQFLVGEGLYVLEEDLLLATPPPHPSEAPVVNVNPLATTPLPATAGPRLSLVSIVDPPRPRALSLLLAAASANAAAAAAATASAAATGATGASADPSATSFSPLDEHLSENESAGGSGGAPASQHTDSATTGTSRLSFHTTSASGASDTALPGAIPIAGAAHAHGHGHGHDSATATATATAVPFPSSLTPASPLSSSLPASFSLSNFGGNAKAAGGKQRKPKNNVTKSNSSFISRVIVHDGLTKRLQERSLDGLFGFANINRAFQWLDLASEKKQDYLTKILFTKAHCLCHDINSVTKSTTHIDVIMGFSTGEIIWWEPISQRYMRLNKNGVIRGTPVSEIRWVPGSENLFMAAFMDGSLVIFDKEKEDAAFTVDEEEASRQRAQQQQQQQQQDDRYRHDSRTHIQVDRSIHSRGHKANPVAFWKLSNQRINAFAFASGQSLLAVVSEDGSLRIIDYLREELLGLFYSYYGGLTCVCWSPDDKYVVTGGQDDLLSIWNVADASLAARCQGHHSWVTSVAFDPWRCDERNYRIGSVGEDCRLCLWDFSMGMLIRPKAAVAATTAPSIHPSRQPARPWSRADSSLSGNGQMDGVETADGTADEASSDAGTHTDERVHLVEPRSRTALLPPVCSQVVAKEPLCWLGFTEKTIVTSGKTGHIRTWKRPTDNSTQTEEAHS